MVSSLIPTKKTVILFHPGVSVQHPWGFSGFNILFSKADQQRGARSIHAGVLAVDLQGSIV